MKFLTLLISISLFFAQESKWSIDKAHSSVKFTVIHLLISEVDGQFNSFDGTIMSDGENFDGASAELTIDAASIFTNQDSRDNHLRTEDFFEVEKYPKITFKSKTFKKVDDKNFKVSGTLTMKDVSKDIELNTKVLGFTESRGSKVVGIKITGTINRKDFNVAPERSSASISDDIEITINARLKMN